MTFENTTEDTPLETTYTFPIDGKSVLVDFEARVGDKVINTKVTEKERAQERYDDAVAGGNIGLLAERKKKDECFTVKLGNLQPGQTAVLRTHIVNQLEVTNGFYSFILPSSFFPEYKSQGGVDEKYPYEFDYEVRIISQGRISTVSLPNNASIVAQNDEKTELIVHSEVPDRTYELYYRTSDMLVPQLTYALSPDGTEVGVSASLVPTFDPVGPQDLFEVINDEIPF